MIAFVTLVLAFCALVVSVYLTLRFHTLESFMAVTSTDLLAAVAADSAKVDALAARLPVPTPPEDLQPVFDAVVALGAKIDAVQPVA